MKAFFSIISLWFIVKLLDLLVICSKWRLCMPFFIYSINQTMIQFHHNPAMKCGQMLLGTKHSQSLRKMWNFTFPQKGLDKIGPHLHGPACLSINLCIALTVLTDTSTKRYTLLKKGVHARVLYPVYMPRGQILTKNFNFYRFDRKEHSLSFKGRPRTAMTAVPVQVVY